MSILRRRGLAAGGLALAVVFMWVASAAAQPIRIAIAAPMAAPPGEQAWNAATLAAEQVNRAGGIKVGAKARPVELVRVDTNEIRSVPEAARALEAAIVKRRVDFIVGGYRDEAVLAMQTVAAARRKLFLGVGAQAMELGARVEQDPARYKYWFRVAPPKSADLGQSLFTVLGALADQVRGVLHTQRLKAGILGEQTVHVDPLVKAAQEHLPRMDLDVVGTWRPAVTATDLSPELNAVKRSGAHVVLTFLSGPLGAVLGRQWNELQVPALPFGINTAAGQDGYWEATGGKGEYVVTLAPYGAAAITPITRPFLQAYLERFHAAPGYAAAAYDAVLLLKTAIEQAGTLTADAVITALEKSDTQATFGRLVFDKRHDPTFAPGYITGLAVQWQGGSPVPIWPHGWKGVTYDGVKPLLLPPGLGR
jgi:branched-chain amino acid transport system substrate-binding protein